METRIRMHLESLTRAIETADPVGFREIVKRYLELRGYRDVVARDGKNDGGADFTIKSLGSNPTPLAIAATVQQSGWKAKVASDCRRAKDALGLTDVVYISAHRRPALDFNPVADKLWSKDEIRVKSVDSQELAGVFFEEKEIGVVLDAVGISLEERRPEGVQRPSLGEDAAYAFAMFGDASAEFRHSVVEQTILSSLTRSPDGKDRAALEDDVASALQLGQDQIKLVSSAADRMLQQQRLHFLNGRFTVDRDVVESFRVMRALRERQWKDLSGAVDTYLGGVGLMGSKLQRASSAVMTRAGALMMRSASAASASIGISQDPAPIRLQLRKRLKEVTVELISAGVPEETVDRHVREIARLVANSELGHILMAGELFVSLAAMQTNQFERAFGANGGSEIYLDASVAIPMIAALMYEPADTRFSEDAVRVFDLAERRGIPLMLPKVYLEEAASHSLEAFDRYQPLLGTDADLTFSTNAYVAHFSDLVARGVLRGDFKSYAENLGYTHRTSTYRRHVDAVGDNLSAIFAQYNIRVVELPSPKSSVRREAEEAITYTANERGVVRHGRLLAHDASVIAQFMEIEKRTDIVRMFCTWDRLHLLLHNRDGRAKWQPLDPPMLGDVLILTRPDEGEELLTTVDVALDLDETEAERGAAILDTLVRIERGNLHDAELRKMLHDFKTAYLQALRDHAEPEGAAEAWSAWKSGDRRLVRQPELPLS
jgi:hypothetical protein